ncbi:MAG: LuxR C-terminal-related transcriptional regulator [Actinomycetota bacterium]|nr:LuxR C-terminal-related transcriptional regulator [Actinomycetota bacterium]
MRSHEALERGWKALEGWSWAEARSAFEQALRSEETAPAWEGLGAAASWLDDARVAIEARECAYRRFRDDGDVEGAARAAAGLADDLLTFRGESAVAAGWLQRGRRGLEGRPDSPILAWLDVLDAFLALAYDRDLPRAMELAETAVARSRRLGDVGTEMVAMSLLGLMLVCSGRFAEGMRMLDEATTAAVAGEIEDPQAAANVCCALVTASIRVRDLDRLSQWSRQVMEISRGWTNRAMFSYPRTEHAVALIWWGHWDEAERELLEVIQDMEGRPVLSALAMLRLSDLRRRQGRFDAAAELLHQLEAGSNRVGMGHLTGAVRAALALDRGDAVRATDLTEAYLRAVPYDDLVERTDGLEVLVRSRVAVGDTQGAAKASDELAALADRIPSGLVCAAAREAAGVVAAGRDDSAVARAALEDALALYRRSAVPFETARVRIELARSLLALGRGERAVEEAQQALDAFDELGAAHEAHKASKLLAALRPATRPRAGEPALTPREIEVLRLVAAGLSNEEIAAALVLSVRTVERHLSNVYAKIGAYGRTARALATAYAHTHGLA